MLKDLGILVGGIFVGAVAAEVIGRKFPRVLPKALDKISSKAGDITSQAKEAFKKGYDNATQPKKPVKSTS